MSALSPRQMFLLDSACYPINEGLGSYGCYLVGTAADPVAARGKRAPRDVDVRFIMKDKTHDRLRKAIGTAGITMMSLGFGQYLASLTGLPIDFQIQRRTEANHHHPDGYRNPLGHRSLSNYTGDAPAIETEVQP